MENIEFQKSFNWYISQFPESQFLVAAKYKSNYDKKAILGHCIAKQSSVLICGIMRNIEKILPYTMARIDHLGQLFKDYHVFLYENDSTDKTKEILDTYRDDKHTIKNETLNPPPFTNLKGVVRRRWMARARNQYLQFARQYAQKNRINFLIIVDTDLMGGWSYHGVLNSLGHKNWDVIGSNSLYYYEQGHPVIRLFYDTWAFRKLHDPHVIDDKKANLFCYHRGEPLEQVNSCFGGLAIYKPKFLFEGVDYTEDDCDHVTLHHQLLKKGYKIYLNPSQITLYNRTDYILC